MINLNVNIPNLPSGSVKLVIVDRNAPKAFFDYLKCKNISFIKSAYLKNTLPSVSTHPDMQICNLGNGNFIAENSVYDYYSDKLKHFGLNLIKGEKVQSNYPYDIAYNVVITGKYFMHNLKYTECEILDFVKKSNYCICNVKQGYTKCATCIIDENAMITSDIGIYNECIKNGIECLHISSGNIILGERTDGFLGGCCGMIGKRELLFCGDIKRHYDYNKIMSFAAEHLVSIVSSHDGMLTDIGSIIPVIQE